MELKLGGNGGGGLITVSGSTRSRAVHVRRHRMQLLAILVGHDVSSSGPGVCAKNHAILEDNCTDGGTSLSNLWGLEPLAGEEGVTLAVLEVESGLGGL